jgi:acyl-CoA thioesterase I
MNHWMTAIVVAGGICLSGCAAPGGPPPARQLGESVVFVGEEPAALAFLPARKPPVRVRSTYLPDPASLEYVEGRDYVVDYRRGTVRRTPRSRLPDFRKNQLYGQEEFDHRNFPGFGNAGFFGFVDYSYTPTNRWPTGSAQTNLLPRTAASLAAGEPLKLVAFGDSITEGGDATKPELIFWKRWAAELERRHPNARVTAVNGATGGDSTAHGLQRLDAKVLAEKPDLVLVAFGMNDHNKGYVAVPQFEENLKQIIARIRAATTAEVILLSAFPPNPKWKFGSHHMEDYAAATERVAQETRCAYADVFTNWQALAARKKPEDLLGNNINHPNDFGHWIYYRVLCEIGL